MTALTANEWSARFRAGLLLWLAFLAGAALSAPVLIRDGEAPGEIQPIHLHSTIQLLSTALIEPPRITAHPQSQTVPPGTNVSLAVQASGTPPLTYQWRLNGVNIPGATEPVLTLTNIEATAGGSYQAIVANSAGVASSDMAAVNVISRPLALADNLSDRMTLVGPSWTGSGSNVGATREPGETNHVGVASGRSVWLAWVAPSNAVATLSTRGSTFDTLLAVYVGRTVPQLTHIVSDEDSGGFYTSTVKFNAVRGTEYLIAIDGFAGASGNVLLSLSLIPEAVIPHILLQPADQTVSLGSEASFLVVATNPPPERLLTYQWRFNGQDILGATNDTLIVTNVQAEAVGHYTVVAKNTLGLELESLDAVLEIGPDARVLSRDKVEEPLPAAAVAALAKTAAGPAATTPGFFSVSVGAIGAQLFDNFGSGKQFGEPDHCDVLGGASKYLDFSSTDSGVIVLDTLGSKIDTVLAVYNRVTLSQLSVNLVACNKNGSADGVHSRVRFTGVAGRAYRAFVDGVGGAQGLIALNWKAGLPPAFAPQAVRRFTVRQNGQLHLETEMAGAFAPSQFQWLHNGIEISSATNALLVLDPILRTHGGTFTVIALNEFGAATNTVAEVVVEMPYLGFQAPASGLFRVELLATAGHQVVLQGSSDLVNWLPLHTNMGSGEALFLDFPTTGAPRQFFRAQPLPLAGVLPP